MSEPILVLFILGTALLIITVVGHGLWLALSWFFGLILGRTRVQRPERHTWNCPQCGRTLLTNQYWCVACGWGKVHAKPAGDSLADLQATARQMERFRDSGALAPATHELVMQAIEAERERLAGRELAARTPAVTAAEPILLPPVVEPVPYAPTAAQAMTSAQPLPRSPASKPIALGQPLPPALPPRKAFSEVLAAFMEEKNIRWGEVVGGLLIIGCSIALVFSLWSTINEIPILKYFLFTAFTSAFFGVGLYTEHRWKLPTTSRGVLIIATLLVPLNFLAIAAFSRDMSLGNPQSLASGLVALGAFSYLMHRSGHVIVSQWSWLLTLGVLGPSAAQLVMRPLAGSAGTELLFVLGALPVLCYGGATALMLRDMRAWKQVGEAESNAVFILFGSISFAALLAFGYLIYSSGRPGEAIRDLAPWVSLGGIPALASGLVLWRQLAGAKLASLRTAATSIGVIGAAAVLGGVALAWPRPSGMLPAAVLDFLALTAVAVLFELPAAHFLATPCLVLAYLITLHLYQNRVHWLSSAREMLGAIFSATSGNGLVAMVLVLGAGSEMWRRFRRMRDAHFYRIATGATVLISLALVTIFGFGRTGDPHAITFVYALYAVIAFIGAWRTGLWQVTWVGSALSLAGTVQAVVFRFTDSPDATHWQLALLLHATAAVLVAAAVRRFNPSLRRLFADPLSFSALASSWIAVPFWLGATVLETTAVMAAYTLWLAAVWFSVSFLHRLAGLFTAAQLMLTLSVLCAVTAWTKTLEWYAILPHPLLDPWVLEIQGIALAILSLAWAGVRIRLRVQGTGLKNEQVADAGSAGATRPVIETLRWLLYPPWPPFDRFVTVLLLLGFVALAAYAVAPGILQEMAPQTASDQAAWNIAGIAHTHVSNGQVWILWGLLLAGLVVRLWERFEKWLVHGIVVTVAAASPLVAVWWDADVATASALRWLTASLLLLASLPIWLRTHLHRLVTPLRWPEMNERLIGLARDARAVLFVVTIAPVLALTIYPALAAIAGHPTMRVAPQSVFGRLGDSVSYVVPLALVFIGLVGHGVRERSASLAFSAGLVLNLAVTLGYLLFVLQTGGNLSDATTRVRLLQLNALAAAGFALAWLTSRGWLLRVFMSAESEPAGSLLRLQVALGIAINVLLLAPADFWLFISPTSIHPALVERASVLGWLAFVMSLAAARSGVFWFVVGSFGSPLAPREVPYPAAILLSHNKFSAGAIFASQLAIGSMVSFVLCNWDAGYSSTNRPISNATIPWLGFHALLASRVFAGCVMLRLGWVAQNSAGTGTRFSFVDSSAWRSAIKRWTTVAAILAVILALRNVFDVRDLSRPWWPTGALVATSVLMAALARWALAPGYLYWAGMLGNLAATSWCIVELWPARGHILDTVHVNVIASALPAVAWLALELQVFRRTPQLIERRRLPAFHHVVAIGSLAMMFLVVAIGLFADAIGHPITEPIAPLGWAAFICVGTIVTACLWDAQARYAMPALYLLGLVGVGMILDQYDFKSHWLAWMAVIILAAYSVATSYLWSQRVRLRSLVDALAIPRRNESPLAGQAWLLVANQLLAIGVVMLAYWIVLTFDRASLGIGAGAAFSLRITAGKAAIAQALAIGLLAQGARRTRLQKVSLWLVAIGAVAWGWAWLDPFTAGNLLNRAVVVLTVLAAMTAFYGIGLTKLLRRENEWTRAAQDIMPGLAALCAGSLMLILGVEVADQVRFGGVAMSGLAILVVALTLTGLSGIGLVLAVVPGRDPFRLTERGRMIYVYASEALLGLLFMHVRLTKPEWFLGYFLKFWPLIVVALAFLGVGLAEIFRRQKRLVLAEPLERTGILLPVLPVLGFWALHYETNYSLVLVLIGLMYGTLSVTRKSFGFGVLASLAANGGLVYLLNQELHYRPFEHAQIWLIPLALCVLAAAYLNREQLTPEQFVAIRYITMMVIYVASTADIFLTGIQAAPWLPMVLTILSVAGIFGGIMLRVRAFLFLGSSFLVLSLVTMILSAHVNLHWTWLWWVAGISLGVAIIAVFALFEKKRHEILQVVDGLKQWER